MIPKSLRRRRAQVLGPSAHKTVALSMSDLDYYALVSYLHLHDSEGPCTVKPTSPRNPSRMTLF